MFTNMILIALLQNTTLFYTDIFLATKPAIGMVVDGHQIIEENPIANLFWENNLWTEGYISAAVVNYAGSVIFLYIDKSGFASILFQDIVSCAEIWAISAADGISLHNINISATLFIYRF
jgi:hypothetical protein